MEKAGMTDITFQQLMDEWNRLKVEFPDLANDERIVKIILGDAYFMGYQKGMSEAITLLKQESLRRI